MSCARTLEPKVKCNMFQRHTFLRLVGGSVDVLGLVDLELPAVLLLLLLLLLAAAKHVTHELLREVLRIAHCSSLFEKNLCTRSLASNTHNINGF